MNHSAQRSAGAKRVSPWMFFSHAILGLLLSGMLFLSDESSALAQETSPVQESVSQPATPSPQTPVDGAKPSSGVTGQPEEKSTATDHSHVADHTKSDEHHSQKDSHTGEAHAGHEPLGKLVSKFSTVPFALLLLSIAAFPLINPHWWEHNSNKGIVVAILSIPVAIYLTTFGEAGLHTLEHSGKEYVSFLLLLGSLFVISGGIYVRGSLAGTPVVNSLLLGFGTVIASFVGTTGASMLLIRPLLRANSSRTRVTHTVVFFIFMVSNSGGLLTPLGDPPLFLGFLKGVPFEWTLRLWPQWLMVNLILLVVYFLWDQIAFRKESHLPGTTSESQPPKEAMGLEGWHNLAFLLGIVAVIYASGQGLGNGGEAWPWGIQELLMLLLLLGSYFMTSPALRTKNHFGFGPIIEVAVLFVGIFITMIPALAILNSEGKNLGLSTEWQYFWATGILSSFLDNAPTYLTFAATAAGIANVPLEGPYLRLFLETGPEAHAILAAISCGAVLMGANTYIGNGPNFMVKAIAEENNIRMPSFFGYMAYSGLILLPIFVLMTFVFFI